MRMHVIISPDLVKAMDEVVGKRKRSRFVAEAIEEKLRRQQLLAAFDEVAGSLEHVDIPGWETPESTAAWVRNQRRNADEGRLPPGWLPEPVETEKAS